MQRRSALGRLAATVTGLSLGRVPELHGTLPLPSEPFVVTRANLAQSSGTVSCPACHTMWDSLQLTPAGLCVGCADANPAIRAEPHSEPVWALSPGEVRRVEAEIARLAGKLERINRRLVELKERQMVEGSDVYGHAVEAQWDEWHGVQRELHLLHLLRAASRQFGTSSRTRTG
jgi:hypothetical protein